MNIYIDIDNLRLVRGINDAQSPAKMDIPCRDTISVKVTILTVNTGTTVADLYVPTDLGAGRSLVFGAKPAVALDGPYFISQVVWTYGATGVYTANIALTNALLVAAVGVDTTVNLLAEFTQIDGAGNNYSSVQFDVSVIPDVTRGGEAAQTLVSPSGGIWVVEIDDNGQLSPRRIA